MPGLEKSSTQETRVYRSRLQSRLIAGFIAVFVFVILTVALTLPSDKAWRGVIVVVVMVPPAIWIGRRAAFGGVFVEDDGVRVVNPFVTRRVPWSKIDRFQFSSYGPALLKLKSGPGVKVFAIQQTNWENMRSQKNPQMVSMLDELNALVDAHRV